MPVTNWLGKFLSKGLGIKPGNPKEVREHIAESIKKAQNRGRVEPDEGGGRSGQKEQDPFFVAPRQNVPWIYVTSSNVHSGRWVGGKFPMQLRFHGDLWWYGYDVTYETWKSFLAAPSKGKFVWYLREGLKAPYRRYYPGSIPPRIIYPWGATGSPDVW